ncbi:SoxR reducing system RseC family protein [Pseudoalteromonas sp. T1lg65]|uniref:SoxR reducing system RseC family protein n=1 Tax=Pseudoalteromonas sp. T1lg65 TaxID=2077101 RepID=UPI003F7B1D89
MIEQTLTVASVKGATVYLQAEPKPACAGCNGKCGSQVFAKLFGTHKKLFPIKQTEVPLQVGQKVKLSLDDSDLVKHAFYIYMLPLLFGFAGMFAALWLQLSEGWQILFAFASAAIGFFLAKMKGAAMKHQVKVVKIYPISLSITQIDGDCTK